MKQKLINFYEYEERGEICEKGHTKKCRAFYYNKARPCEKFANINFN